MSITEILITSVALAMDAFAVAICKGLSMKRMSWNKAVIVGLYFGIFQAGMPLIGYYLGATFETLITNIDHWVAFVLLGIIGANMIKEAFSDGCECHDDSVTFKTMLPLAVATSIDALAIGVMLAVLKADVALSVTSIGVITFLISMIGVKIGNVFGDKYEKKATFVGGVILVLMGIKILLEHIGIIG